MKKLIMTMVLSAGLFGFAAANDPLISTRVERGATYDLLCKGEKLFSFTSNETGKINVQGVASKSAEAGDYQVRLAAAPTIQDGSLQNEGGEEVKIDECYYLAGPDCYADGSSVLDGEIYALVVTKPGKTFTGFVNRGSTLEIVCADQENSVFVQMFGKAQGGKCVLETIDTARLQRDYEGWTLAVYLLDTRKPGMSDLSDRNNGGLPTFVQAYHELGEKTSVSVDGWQKVQLAKDGLEYPFDISAVLADGYAATCAGDLWTVREMPTAYAEEKKENTVFEKEDDMIVLRRPAALAFPCSNEVDYVFHVAETEEMCALIAKVVANRPLLNAIMKGEDVTPYLSDFTPEELALFGGELSAWATKVMPFFSWNADFVVSFDRLVKQGSVLLDGQYDGAAKWNFNTWVGATFADDMLPGQPIRLLKEAYQEVYLNYSEICTNVIQFQCGAMNFSPENWGTTMKVALKLYENEGRCQEKGEFTVGTYKYTFRGPVNIKFYDGEGNLLTDFNSDGVVGGVLSTNNAGVYEFPVPAYKTSDPYETFRGWTNKFGKTVATLPSRTLEPAEAGGLKSWYTGGDDTLELYAKIEKAIPLTVTVKDPEKKIDDQTPQIKVAETWIDETFKEQGITAESPVEEIKKALEAPQGEAQRPAWQNYLLGMDPDADLKVERTNGDEDDKALVVSTVDVVAPDAGIKVQYSLDKVEADVSKVEKTVAKQDTKDLKIDLEPEGDTPTGYYKMNVIITPTTDKDGQTVKGEPVKIPAENTIGVLKVETEESLVPVAVPWTSLTSGDTITVDEVVKTSTLSTGDQMHVYDNEAGVYHNYELKDGAWTPGKSYLLDKNGKVTKTETVSPDTKEIPQGAGVWLERKETSKPFYLIGSYKEEDEGTITVNGPKEESTAARPVYNLIAPIGIEPTDLNEVKSLQDAAKDANNENDQLVIMRNGISTRYTVQDNKWGYNKTQIFQSGSRIIKRIVFETSETKVDAGIGLWYIKKGQGDMDITWKPATSADGE